VVTPEPALPTPARAATKVAILLIAAGVAVGFAWLWWAPARPAGLVVVPGGIQVDETESFVAGDGRFALLAGLVGLAAGLGVWWWQRAARGPVVALGLAAGAGAGSWLAEAIGRLFGGGRGSAPAGTTLAHLPLSVHMHALRLLEPMTALLAYAVCTAFAGRDDLGVAAPVAGADALTVPSVPGNQLT
jgi:hypothetical protein